MFKWNKKGKIFEPQGQYPWMHSHAQCPVPLDFGDFIRVYISTREAYHDGLCRSCGAFVDLDKNNLKKVINISSEPVTDFGGIGEFDEFGVMPNSVVPHNDEYYLYYSGWTRSVSTPYSWEVGLAVGVDGARFKKPGKGPVIGPSLHEPYLHACPIVYKYAEEDWHMFYLSGLRWLEDKGKIESQYLLVHATSTDGINWNRDPRPIVEPKVEFESQTSAAIIRLDGRYHMFFCYRHGLDFRHGEGRGYRIGHAVSDDLFSWTRDDSQAGLDVSESGWDSEMVAYPRIIEINNKFIMFYNGNGFGKTGFGYAELELI